MPSKVSPSAIRLNCSRAKGADVESSRAGASTIVWKELSAGEDLDRVDVGDAALVGDVEARQPFDLVAVAVDSDAVLAGRREDVDDPAANGDLTAVLDLVLAAIPRRDERRHEPVRVDLALRSHDDWCGIVRKRGESLYERLHGRDDECRAGIRSRPGDAPECLQATAHRLHRRGDPLEGQRLPRWEVRELGLVQEAPEVVEKAFRLGSRGRRDDDHRRRRKRGDASQDIGACRVGDGDRRVLRSDEGRERRFGGERRQQRGERRARHEAFTLSIAAAMPRSKISSAASAASSMADASAGVSSDVGRRNT